MNIVLRRFLHIEAMSRQEEARSRGYALLLFRKVFIVHSYYRQHYTLHVFEQFGELYNTQPR